MPNLLSFYIIFHQRIFHSNTAGFSKDQIQKYFVWMGVNEKLPKQIPDKMKEYPFVYEYGMRWQSPLYQMLNFYQNSVFFHLWKNPEVLPQKYIGFGQYDMTIAAEPFLEIAKELEQDDGKTFVGVYPYSQGVCFDLFKADQWKGLFMDSYNKFYHKQHTLESLRDIPHFLIHTFILPKSFFLSMMPFVDSLLPNVLKALNWETRHLAGTLERVFALCIACAIKEKQFNRVLVLKGITHEESQHEEDTLRGIQKGQFQEA